MLPEELGKKLLAEVEEVGLDEILQALPITGAHKAPYFGIPQLDGLLQSIAEARTPPTKRAGTAPIVELMSQLPGDGKTHLLYQLTASAILTRSLGGHEAAVIVLDADGRFSVPRLVQQLKCSTATGDMALQSLQHVHIFRPQSLLSTISTISSLQTYLFNPTAHQSFDRPIAFIALDSASAFYWQARTEAENAAVLSSSAIATPPLGYIQLAASLKNASRIFSCPIIFTTWYLGPAKKLNADMRSFRPSLPPPWQSLAMLRLIVRRIGIRKLPVEMSVEESQRESQIRQKAVEKGMFECFINEWDLDERTLQRLQGGRSEFRFSITEEGVQGDKEGGS